MEDRANIPPGLPKSKPVQSYWQEIPDAVSDHRTTQDLPSDADIVIVGSGISGASVAFNLLSARPSSKIVMLEARQAASGASGRNGGHTKTASYRSFSENVEMLGIEDAVKIARLEYNCMIAVHDFIKDNNIDCEGHRCDTLDVFYDEQEWQKAKLSVELMRKLMGDNDPAPRHEFYNSKETATKFLAVNSFGSLRYEAGSLNAYKFTIGMLKLALDQGLNLQCNTPVQGIRQVDHSKYITGWVLDTDRGQISTKKVILATNGYSAHILPKLQGVITPFRGIVTAQRPGNSMPQQGLETTYSFIYKNGYEYMISRPQGSRYEGDIVIGGGLTKGKSAGVEEYGNTNDSEIDKDIANYLESSTQEFFGSNWGADHADGRIRKTWSGVMGYSADGQPFVGPFPDEPGLFIDASFQGHGMVLCFLCAQAVTKMILGEDGDELKSWFPNSFRVTEERLQKKFHGRYKVSRPSEILRNVSIS